jgi:hypothetical protein
LIIVIIFVSKNNSSSNNSSSNNSSKNNLSSNNLSSNNPSSNIYFFTKKEAQEFIWNDKDNYITGMSKSDLIARNYIDVNEYKTICATSALEDFTKEEKNELIYLFNQIKTNPFIFGNYNFIKINDVYESGYPHTRENIIFIPQSFFGKEIKEKEIKEKKITLLHECIHIYQRYHPKETEEILNSYQFYKVGNFKSLFPDKYIMRRSNPDLDGNIWKDKDGVLMFPIFNSLRPKNMSDILTHDDREHPYEWMAYTFSKI